ncbi:MAG: transporter substrate-binding domain-containing protein, partial [Atribacterota bacterium]|nr:transporter substrate-binding domain-containing protein [Atribacterota bacterium]
MRKFISLFSICFIIFYVLTASCFAAEDIRWTKDEAIFINENPVIRLGVDPKFVPFEFFDENGEYKGITADYLSLISERTGLKFEIARGLTWPEAYDMALSGEVDALPAISRTEERGKYFLFSQPYFYFKRVIVTQNTDTGISDMDDLAGVAVAVQRNSSHHSYLLSYPNINLSLYDSVEAALASVASGAERVFLGNLATTDYLVRTNAITNLKFIVFEAEKEQALYFAVRKDWPELVSIINKALNNISEEEKIAISNKWIEFKSEVNYGPIIRIILIIGSILAGVIVVSFFWIIRLKKEIKKRKQIQLDLEKAKKEAEEANDFKSSFM